MPTSTPDINPPNTVQSEFGTYIRTPALPKEPSPDGDAAVLWGYLQPHLSKYRGPDIPAQGWVRQLVTLPRVRDVDWNTPWLSAHPFSDTNPRDISALIIQVTGEPAPQPCNKCATGRGPFASCVVISTRAPNGPLGNILSCANCFYHFGQTYCSLKHWGRERARPIVAGRRERDPLDELLDEMAAEAAEEREAEERAAEERAAEERAAEERAAEERAAEERAAEERAAEERAAEERAAGERAAGERAAAGLGVEVDDYEGIVESQEGDVIANDDDIMDHSVFETPPALGHIPAEIFEAEPGRPYTMWPGEWCSSVLRKLD